MSQIQEKSKSCGDCGWKYPGFHICLGLPPEIMERVEEGRKKEAPARVKSVPVENRTKFADRNREIIRLYDEEDFTMREVAEKLKIDQRTVMNILHNARDKGDVVIRRAVRRTGRY